MLRQKWNYPYPRCLFPAVQRKKNTVSGLDSLFLRTVCGVVALLLITLRLSSPFLHTHQFSESSRSELGTAIHCDACDYEATQLVEPDVAVLLPVNHFSDQLRVFTIEALFLAVFHSSLTSRGPPTNS